MLKSIIAYNLCSLSPFDGGGGGDFKRAKKDPRLLVMELQAEQEEIRSNRRVLQERLSICRRMIADCATESPVAERKTVYAWLTGAAVSLIFGLLFSAGAGGCGACGRFGMSTLLIVVGIVLGLRAWGEYNHVEAGRKNHDSRIAQYQRDSDLLNEQINRLNLREAELEQSIRSAERYL